MVYIKNMNSRSYLVALRAMTHLAHELLDDGVEHLGAEGVLPPDAQGLVEVLTVGTICFTIIWTKAIVEAIVEPYLVEGLTVGTL